jgi:predicted ATPase/class 3 adenylate cyclase
MPGLPTGTVTFLFTDIEGSTTLLQRLGDRRYAEVLAEHQQLLRDAFAKGNGQEIDTQGDAFLVAFSRARDAVETAVAAQRALKKHLWPDGASLQVRMGLHTGEPVSEGGNYVGLDVHRAARICAAGHGGQVLLSDTTHALVAKDLPGGVGFRDLGEHRLKDLAHRHRLFQIVVADLPSDFLPLKTLSVLPNNLPVQLTSFIGREHEVSEAKRLFSACRLVTLIGPGGIGKTRLALRLAAELLEQYPDGVWWVELAPLSEPALVPQAVATALQVREQPGRPLMESLLEYLQPKTMLLVLDNLEHLIHAGATLVETLLRRCLNLRILVTSRERVAIAGETLFQIPSLSLPDVRRLPVLDRLTEYEAMRLFVDRAEAILPKFKLAAQNAQAVAGICSRLEGLPLAIELAAARVNVLSVQQILSRLDDRLHMLSAASRAAVTRHQSLQAAIDWSYDLLSEKERILLRRVSVFAGGWTLEAAEQVCVKRGIQSDEVLGLLAQLVHKSLVAAESSTTEARFELLETLRQYCWEKLADAEEAVFFRSRHQAWCLGLAEQAEQQLHGADQGLWLERLETEHDNLRAALQWGQEDVAGREAALRLASALWWFWLVRGHLSEARQALERTLANGNTAGDSIRSDALWRAGRLALAQDDFDLAATLTEEGLALSRRSGNARGTASALNVLGEVAIENGDQKRAIELFEESLATFRRIGDSWGAAQVLKDIGTLARRQGDYARALRLLEESLGLFRRVSDKGGSATVLSGLSLLEMSQGKYARAVELLEERLAISRELGLKLGIANSLQVLGRVARMQGFYEKAAALLEESVRRFQETGERAGLAASLTNLGIIAWAQGDLGRAATLIEQSLGVYDQLDSYYWGKAAVLEVLGVVARSQEDYDRALTLLHESLGIYKQFERKPGIAGALLELGILAQRQGRNTQAMALFSESLQLLRAMKDRRNIAGCLEGLGSVAAEDGQGFRAAKLFGAAYGLREEIGAPLPPVELPHHERAVAMVRTRLGEERFAAALAEGRAMSLEQAIECALALTAK